MSQLIGSGFTEAIKRGIVRGVPFKTIVELKKEAEERGEPPISEAEGIKQEADQLGIFSQVDPDILFAFIGCATIYAVKHDKLKDIVPLLQTTVQGFFNMLVSLFQASAANPTLSIPVVIMTANFAQRMKIIDPLTESIVRAGALGLGTAKAISEIVKAVIPDFMSKEVTGPQALQFDVADALPDRR